MIKEFKNEEFTDFNKLENKNVIGNALQVVKKELGCEYAFVIGGKKVKSKDKFKSYNPANKNEVVGILQQASIEQAKLAVSVAEKRFDDWRWRCAEERAGYLFKMAKIMRDRKFELEAWLVYEVGKNWVEADGDVAEAIDFLEFYGREALRYGAEQEVPCVNGEVDELRYIPLGVGLIIPPWNFPLAILCGMTSAAFVCGNTVVLKPSSDSPVIAEKFMEIVEEAGVPDGVVNLVTGRGGVIGDTLVRDNRVRFIAFTGSKEVGLHINELANKMQDGQIWIKRVVAEMGGKDAIIVDESADIDDAVKGVIASAFGYQGQKCSACSRALVDGKIYKEFVRKLVGSAKAIKVGDPVNNNFMGAVINEKAYKSILEYIKIGRKEGRLECGGNWSDKKGYFIEPTIIVDVKSDARISREEIFGPVLAVTKTKDFDDAMKVANSTVYGLTGAVYTRNRSNIERSKKEFHCGNLYFNRKCTGALVGVHPFGGFNLSGTDSKAGGKDYLLLFLQAKSMAEKI